MQLLTPKEITETAILICLGKYIEGVSRESIEALIKDLAQRLLQLQSPKTH